MEIQTVIKNIVKNIAWKLGLELREKTPVGIDYTASGLNPTAIGASAIANIAIDDSDIIVDGDNARAVAIREIVEYFSDEIESAAAEVALGTGDCIVRPFTDGQYIGLNVIGGDNFIITESVGSELKGVIMKIDEYKTEKAVFRLFESQTLQPSERSGSVVCIKRFAYRDETEITLSQSSWGNIPPEEWITADQLLLGRYKCPTINRNDYNSASGVPITFGNEKIIENIKQKYTQYNEEFDRKEAIIFADRTMFQMDNQSKKDDDGKRKLKLAGKQFVKVRGDLNRGVSEMIQDYSPEIRESDFQAANHFNLSVLELCCGFSRGIFTSPETAFATATEMKNSLKKTFAFVKRFRKRMEAGNKMLFHAVDIIMNINRTTPYGEWELRHDWSYDYIEQTTERFNQLVQAHAAGAVKTEDITSWVLGLDQDEAKLYVAEIRTEESDDKTFEDE